MAVFAAAVCNYGSRATFVDLMAMRELVEGTAVLAACVYSTDLPAIVRVLGEVAFLLAASVMWTTTSIFEIVPLKGIGLVLKFEIYLIDLVLGAKGSRNARKSQHARKAATFLSREDMTKSTGCMR